MVFFIDIMEGVIFGVLFVILIRILGVEVNAFQTGVLVGFSIFAVTVLNGVGTALKNKLKKD